jgi:hypothetical protein
VPCTFRVFTVLKLPVYSFTITSSSILVDFKLEVIDSKSDSDTVNLKFQLQVVVLPMHQGSALQVPALHSVGVLAKSRCQCALKF